jgi:ribosomal protein S18 acetylase RimI-like enzyme
VTAGAVLLGAERVTDCPPLREHTPVTALVEHILDMPGDRRCVVRIDRADPHRPGLVDVLVDIDLRCFVESTFSRYSAAALAHAGLVWVIEADGDVVGTCVVLRSAAVPHEGMVLTMGILPGWRGRGLGVWFVGCVLDALAVEGFSSVSLLVGADNTRALHLYRDLGFQVAEDLEADPVTGDRQLVLRAGLVGRLTGS